MCPRYDTDLMQHYTHSQVQVQPLAKYKRDPSRASPLLSSAITNRNQSLSSVIASIYCSSKAECFKLKVSIIRTYVLVGYQAYKAYAVALHTRRVTTNPEISYAFREI